MPGAQDGQKRVSDLLKLELGMSVTPHAGVERAARALNCWSSPAVLVTRAQGSEFSFPVFWVRVTNK